MSTDRDVTRIVRSWLEGGRTALPDRVLDAVLDQLPTTPQRRAAWPARRLYQMKTPINVALAAAAFVVVVAAGMTWIARPRGVAAPGPSPSLSPAPTPRPTLLPSTGDLNAGTYYIPAGPTTPVGLTVTVPAGWSADQGFIAKGSARQPGEDAVPYYRNRNVVVPWIVTHVYSDICHNRKLVSAGTTTAQLRSALEAQTGRTISAPVSLSLNPPGWSIEMTVPANLDPSTCDDGNIRFWPDPGSDESGGLCCSAPGSTDSVHILQAADRIFVIVARHQATSTPAEIAELGAIVESIRLDPPAPSTSPASG